MEGRGELGGQDAALGTVPVPEWVGAPLSPLRALPESSSTNGPTVARLLRGEPEQRGFRSRFGARGRS